MQQTLQAGTVLQQGKYMIQRVLGQGGFGITYEGVQVGLNRHVAIKEFFIRDFCQRQDTTVTVTGTETATETVGQYRHKFIKEAQMIASMSNMPHMITIYDIFEENETAYYVMEFIEGGSLRSLVQANGPLSQERAVAVTIQVAQALATLHQRKVMHLDVKPDNVLLRAEDDIVLIDFGVSKHYDQRGSATTVTPVGYSKGFAPVEQYREGGVDRFSPATDVYSLGATLYYLISGQTPPEATALIDDPLPRLSGVSDDVWHVISRAMQSSRKARYQSAQEMAQALRATLVSSPQTDTDLTEEEVKPSVQPTDSQATLPSKQPVSESTVQSARYVSEPTVLSSDDDDEEETSSRRQWWKWALGAAFAAATIALLFVIFSKKEHEPTPLEIYYQALAYYDNNEYDQAFPLMLQAAEAGLDSAQNMVGWLYDGGMGTAKNDEEACKWYLLAAEAGNANAQSNIGVKYLYIEDKLEEGVRWLRKAAEQNHAGAQDILGRLYLQGHGVPKDTNEAIKWLRKAEEQQGAPK